MSAYNQKSHLLRMIDDAFAGVELGNGVSLHETIVLDMYGTDAERKRARGSDEKANWRMLVNDPELRQVCGIGGLSFFDACGFRFHLPAYLYLLITEPDADTGVIDSLIFVLTDLDDYNRERLAILTECQRRCVWQCLVYIRHNTGRLFEYEHQAIDNAIESYWKPQQAD